ncbi:MAG: hypothetical protein BWY52_01322 [Chloroflexi bacterium ADurb.Bin325]|nr:MAG: hypothetical protein BWY52_01322 [Chloroflexi bacterium ADurb.Bin325]
MTSWRTLASSVRFCVRLPSWSAFGPVCTGSGALTMLLLPLTGCQLARPASNPPFRSRSTQPAGAAVPVGVAVGVAGVVVPVGVAVDVAGATAVPVPVAVGVAVEPLHDCSETSSRNIAARPPRPSL